MKTSLLITTIITAAMLAGTAGIAPAQYTGADPKQDRNAAPSIQMKSQDKVQNGAQNSGQVKPGPATQDKAASQSAPDKAAQDKAAQDKAKDNSKTTAQQPSPSPSTTGQNTQRQTEPMRQQPASQQPKATQGQGTGSSAQSQTQVQAQTGKNSVTLTTEQKATIRQSVLGARSAPKVANVNFSINVGAQVPRTVHLVAVPEPLFRIHPAWRGLLYFIVGDEIIIVDIRTHEIVAVLEV